MDVPALAARHPLAAEQARLRALPAATVPASPPVSERWSAALSGEASARLPEGASRRKVRAALAERAARARASLEQSLRGRQERRREQQSTELLAVEGSALAEQEQILRRRIEGRVREAAMLQGESLSSLIATEQVYRAQLRAGVAGRSDARIEGDEVARLRPLGQPTASGLSELRAQVGRLKGPLEGSPSPRARMRVMAEAATQARQRAQATLDGLWDAGKKENEEASRRARAAMEARVRARLARLGARPASRASAMPSLVDVLGQEERLSAVSVPARALRRVELAAGSSSPSGTAVPGGNRSALLASLLEQDVAARVRDAAQRQRLELVERRTGVADRTAQVGSWVGLGQVRQ